MKANSVNLDVVEHQQDAPEQAAEELLPRNKQGHHTSASDTSAQYVFVHKEAIVNQQFISICKNLSS